MPLPLGHATLGLVAYEATRDKTSAPRWWVVGFTVAVLANLPDIDVVIGLICKANGWAFHRGPTHSLAFSLICGLAASWACRTLPGLPRLHLRTCILIIQSHIIADLVQGGPVSVFWPFQLQWAGGHIGWSGVLGSVVFEVFNDFKLIIAAGLVAVSIRIIRQPPESLRPIARVLFPSRDSS
ncbi:MAG: metal-dependent hydrolase [Deltaproteobacteria bacterium]|nr:metal-dependent hydrolase [Deltaproteobacteria bacterium]